jgi:hypothetical protein
MRRATVTALALALSFASTTNAEQRVLLSTENDLFTNSGNRDDLYTFSVALAFDLDRGYGLTFRENAFTDRDAGLRFDETYLSVGRRLPWLESWNLHAEAGLARRGRGLFGESAQNAVHRAIGAEEVELRYRGSSLHPRLALHAERRFAIGPRWDWGPRVELELVPGLRSFALLAAEATWSPAERLAVELAAGGRFTDASYAPLERHLAGAAPAARLGLVYDRRYFLSWSYNDYGDEREHLSAGVRVALDRAIRSAGGGAR